MLFEDDIAAAIVQSDLDHLLAQLPNAEAQKVCHIFGIKDTTLLVSVLKIVIV